MRLSREAIDELFRVHNRTLNGLARRRVGRDDAEDVIQDAYLRLLELEGAERLADPRSYLFRIASNMSIDWRRRRKSRSAYMQENGECEELAASEPAYAASVEDAIMVCKVQISLSQLPRCCRDAFLLSRLYGMSYPEIAERLNVSLRTVNRNVSKAVYHLDLAFGIWIGVDKSDSRRAPSEHEPRRDQQNISAQHTRNRRNDGRISGRSDGRRKRTCDICPPQSPAAPAQEIVAVLQQLDDICVVAPLFVD